ncbi:hypothetical protein B5X24_HaOG204833 [Helicoverpa armigera]|uniref:Uncharacterized protein n=1 Tax=Helicoverpa armigera TaxID=29058 RepID=A0A2W1BMW8_HELAM|nr:hypothetical protein B5X24_HaOG204833 [Helicoverpa armigera]
MIQVVQSPTHFVGESSTLIDIVCTDIKVRDVVVSRISDLGNHSFITCEAVIKKEKVKPRIVAYRPLKDVLVDQFNSDLISIPWSEISEPKDVNRIVTQFGNVTIQLFDLHAPIRTKRFKDLPTPWITDNIKLMFKLRDAARVNTSIQTNTFPDAWKCAAVRPLPKISDPNSFKDLRPISILPCLSKVLERVVYNQTLNYLEDNNILPDLQSGFRKGRGTATALADVVAKWWDGRHHVAKGCAENQRCGTNFMWLRSQHMLSTFFFLRTHQNICFI